MRIFRSLCRCIQLLEMIIAVVLHTRGPVWTLMLLRYWCVPLFRGVLSEKRIKNTEQRITFVSLQLQEGGCTFQTGDVSEATTVQDVRKLRRMLGSRLLSDNNLRMEFLQLLERRLCAPANLRRLLLPLAGETQVMGI